MKWDDETREMAPAARARSDRPNAKQIATREPAANKRQPDNDCSAYCEESFEEQAGRPVELLGPGRKRIAPRERRHDHGPTQA